MIYNETLKRGCGCKKPKGGTNTTNTTTTTTTTPAGGN